MRCLSCFKCNELLTESQGRLALLDFLKGLVEFDPAKRWSPFQVIVFCQFSSSVYSASKLLHRYLLVSIVRVWIRLPAGFKTSFCDRGTFHLSLWTTPRDTSHGKWIQVYFGFSSPFVLYFCSPSIALTLWTNSNCCSQSLAPAKQRNFQILSIRFILCLSSMLLL